MAQAVTQDEALRRIRAALGDEYDLNKAVYVDSKTKITVICSKHGEFQKVLQLLCKGYGCNPCSRSEKCIPLNEWTRRFAEVHGASYSYEKVEHPVDRNIAVTVTCPEHGDFLKTPAMLIKGYGCNECSEGTGLPRETWIERFHDVHGERYEYGEIFTVGITRYISVKCPEHGEFRKQLNDHWTNGRGCNTCDKAKWMSARRDGSAPRSKNMMTHNEVIDRFTATHGDTYGYSKVIYSGTSCNVTITCKVHGDFEQSPQIHWNGSGCKKCTMKAVNKKTLDEVLSLYAEVHGDRYDYSLITSYEGVEDEFSIICPSHGEFKQKARSHWIGYGCWDCSREVPARLFPLEEALRKCVKTHGDTYDYSRVKYDTCHTPVDIICKKHGAFSQRPSAHWRGAGCPHCAEACRTSKEEDAWASALQEATGWSITRNRLAGMPRGGVDMLIDSSPYGKLAIEYDGDYWHSRPGAFENDEKKSKRLTKLGYIVVRLRVQGKFPLQPIPSAALNFEVTPDPTESQVLALLDELDLLTRAQSFREHSIPPEAILA
jgi:hypothetical protein